MSLKNKVILITGASKGLGKSLVELLSTCDTRIIALARSINSTNLPKEVTKIPCNVRDLLSIDLAFKTIDKDFKKIDILINCVGRALVKPLEDTSREEIMDVFGINLKGNIYIAQEVYKRMLPHKSGQILNVVSTSGIRARENETIYAASKWGLKGFTDSLRAEAKPNGIKVLGVYPGGMRTDFWSILPDKDISKYMDPALIAKHIVNMLDTEGSISPTDLVIDRF